MAGRTGRSSAVLGVADELVGGRGTIARYLQRYAVVVRDRLTAYDKPPRRAKLSPQTRSLIYLLLFRGCEVVLRKDDDDWVKKCMEYEVEGSRPRGRPGKRLYVRTVKHVS